MKTTFCVAMSIVNLYVGIEERCAAQQAVALDVSAKSKLIREASEAVLFHAPFDGDTDARRFQGDGKLLLADPHARDHLLTDKASWDERGISIAKGEGRFGDAVRFTKNAQEVVFYEGAEFGYRTEDWSGSVSIWMKLDPDKDLAPGFCDPIQITERGWNDGAFFVDFDKELPRDFRLGVFADLKSWNPENKDFDDVPVAERPMVVVKDPPFKSNAWTHVCFTWTGVNSVDGRPATCVLYLNGEAQGELTRPLAFTWDPKKAAIMLGFNYIGLMDDLIVFRKSLSEEQVKLLYERSEAL